MSIFNLVKGTKIVLTKKSLKTNSDSAFKQGEMRSGTLSYDIENHNQVCFKEWGGGSVTSQIQNIEKVDDEIILETATSIYSVRIVENKDDPEFIKWLGC